VTTVLDQDCTANVSTSKKIVICFIDFLIPMTPCYSDLNNLTTHNSATVSQKQYPCQEKWIFLRSAVSFAQTISNTHTKKKRGKTSLHKDILI